MQTMKNSAWVFRCLLVATAVSFTACNRQSADANFQETMKTAIAGDWEEAHGSQEKMHFGSDGSLTMNSRAEHHSCTYDFPDAKHIRLDCVPGEVPQKGKTYGFALEGDKLMISEDDSTGTYVRK